MPDNPRDATNQIQRSLKDIDWAKLSKGRTYYPSPVAWEDEVLYFLFVDRFSDGREFGGFANLRGRSINRPTANCNTPLFHVNTDAGNANRTTWFEAGKTWCGGTFAGIKDKLGYLKRLGITCIWLSPIFRQVTGSEDYHGYGIQNFLDVDPHFGTREELKALVEAAHDAGIRIILDIILNHAGDVFAYKDNHPYYYFQGRQWPIAGFRTDRDDPGSLPFSVIDTQAHPQAWPNQAVWPSEFQQTEAWTRHGQIRGWDSFPEYLDGDFLSLKDLDHGQANTNPAVAWDVQRRIREFQPAATLAHLTDVYKFWIAYADIDGFRIDTVKHMEPGAVRYFVNAIHEFAESLGKEQLYLIGEITGGRANAMNILNTTGLDAALGINDIPDKLENLAKGWRSPGDPRTDAQEGYFDLFRNSLLDNKHTHQWFGKHVVTMFDDHDQVGVQHKYRFCGDRADSHLFLPVVLGLNLTTVGIPCLYYGTEQAFNGADHRGGGDDSYSDVFLRECLFGGPFGSVQSTGKHFFHEQHSAYQFIQEVCSLRQQHIALRRGRQYLREVSATGNVEDFHYPQPLGGQLRWVVGWSRIFADQEYLCAINTNAKKQLRVWVTLDNSLNPAGKKLVCLFSTKPSQKGSKVTVQGRNGSAVLITVPPAGFVVYH